MNWYVKIGDKQFHLHAVISVVVLALLIYFERAGGRSYFDEGLALLCMVYVMVLFLKGRLIVEDQISVLLLISGYKYWFDIKYNQQVGLYMVFCFC